MTSDIGKKTIKSSMYGPIIPSPTAMQCAILMSLVSFRFISFRGGGGGGCSVSFRRFHCVLSLFL